MIQKIKIENFKSIHSLEIELGRFNVLIGENGSGKTNILEAIAFAGAASTDRLDNEFLGPRGIRVTEPEFMRAAFGKEKTYEAIIIEVFETNSDKFWHIELNNQNEPYSSWMGVFYNKNELASKGLNILQHVGILTGIQADFSNFLIYCPENTSLRNFHEETQIEPLGIRGEGLFKLLNVFQKIEIEKKGNSLSELKNLLQVIDWFEDFSIKRSNLGERTLNIKDRYLDNELEYFSQRSANEGFLYLLFYFSLFISEHTPKFFAIDNIENALNPGLCRKLIQMLTELAIKHDKQVILTTHNPAILDGLNLNDDDQRLFIVKRNKLGHTKVKRYIHKPRLDNGKPLKLSEKLMRGYLGAIQNF